MKKLLLVMLLLALVVSPVLATNAAYGGVLTNYTNTSGGVNIETRVNIPLTVEDVAYPEWLWVLFALVGIGAIAYSISLIARNDGVPSIAIVMCGIFAFGAFLICAYMAPYVASIDVTKDVVIGCDNESDQIFIEQSVTYLFSPWVGWACWGGAIAGFIIAVAGTLSFFGWFHRKGMSEAKRGSYIETDAGDVVNSRNMKNKF